MDKKVEKFKADYSSLESHVKLLKKKQLELKKEIKRLKREAKSVANKAENLYDRGFDTMYINDEGGDWEPKFRGFINMMCKLERIMCIDQTIQRSLDEEVTAKA